MSSITVRIVMVLALLLLFIPDKVSALSCAELSGPREALERNGAAVYGKVKQVKADIEQEGFVGTKEYVTNVLLEVERSWGIEADSQMIAAADYTWGYDYQKGESYLVFLSKQQDRMVISPCSPTLELASVDEAVELLGAGSLPAKQVNLAYRMWFMFDTDIDMLIAGGILVAAAIVLCTWLIRRRRGNRES